MHDSLCYDDGAFYYYCDLAVEYTEKRNSKKADECISEAARLTDGTGVLDEDPNYAHVYFEMGNIWSEKGYYDRAVKHYEMAREEYSWYAEIAYDFVERLERWDNAIHCCVCITAIDHGNAEAFLNMGIAYYSKEDYDKAIECYEKAVVIKPDYIDAHNNRELTLIGELYENTLQRWKHHIAKIEDGLALVCPLPTRTAQSGRVFFFM